MTMAHEELRREVREASRWSWRGVVSVTGTLGLCIGAIAVAALLELRRRRGRDAILIQAPPISLDTGGAPPQA